MSPSNDHTSELVLDWRPRGNRARVSVSLDGTEIHVDEIVPSRKKDRDAFLRDVAKCSPAVDRDELDSRLMDISREHAGAGGPAAAEERGVGVDAS